MDREEHGRYRAMINGRPVRGQRIAKTRLSAQIVFGSVLSGRDYDLYVDWRDSGKVVEMVQHIDDIREADWKRHTSFVVVDAIEDPRPGSDSRAIVVKGDANEPND